MAKDAPVRILIIDADEESYLHAQRILHVTSKKKYLVERASDYDEALNRIEKKEHDIYLVDSALGAPGKTGLDLIRKSIKLGNVAPHVLLISNEDEHPPEEVYKAGAMNQLVKSKLTPHQVENAMQFCLKYSTIIRKIKKQNALLQQKIEEKNQELVRRLVELEHSKKLVEEALGKEKELNRLKSRLMTMALHEFRTPLGIILSSTELVTRYGQKNDLQNKTRHINRIKNCVTHLSSILDDFALVDQSDAGPIQTSEKIFEIDVFCKKVIEEIISFTITKPEIIYKHATVMRSVSIDDQLLGRVIRHLVVNAIKFSGKDPRILVSSSVEKGMLEITVTDHGIGIPEADQKYIFERFFRASNTVNLPGTGIGLNLIAAYVKKMGGAVTFTSAEGRGTTFRLQFPIGYIP